MLSLGNILITGASKGIGFNIFKTLLNHSENLYLSYNSNDNDLRSFINDLEPSKKAKCKVFHLDQSCKNSIDNFSSSLAGIELDGVVLNAGINNPTDFDKVEVEDWDEIFDTNLRGPFFLIQSLIPNLNDGASIVSIGSVSGQYGGPRTPHYAASKAGLISLTQVMARFLSSKNIRANTVSAGLISSEMASAGLNSAAVQSAAENILLSRLGTQEEVSNTVHFLLSDMSSYITAQVINVNGGIYF